MRKLAILAITAMAIMATTATTANADTYIQVSDAESAGTPCDPTCIVEDFSGNFTMGFYYNGQFNPVQGFDIDLDFEVGLNGSLETTDVDIAPTGGSGYQRQACPGENWTGQIRSIGNGQFQADLDTCITTIPASNLSRQSITLDLALDGDQLRGMDQTATTSGGFHDGLWGTDDPYTVYIHEIEE